MAVSIAFTEHSDASVACVRRLLPQLLAGWLGALCAYVYAVTVVQPRWDLAAALHAQVINGTAPSPYRSRILMPMVAEQLSRFMSLESAFLLLYFVLFPVAFCGLYALLREWYPATLSLLGTVIAAAVMPLALRDHYYQPGTWLELVLVIAALKLLARPRLDLRWYAAVAVTAALNRETGMLLGLLLLVVAWRTSRRERSALLLTAVAPVITYCTIRVVRGGGPAAEHDLLSRNLSDAPTAFVQLALFGAVLVYLMTVAWPQAPAMLRRAMWIVPPYLALIAAFGIWRETRLLVPLLPLALGIGLGALTNLDEPVSDDVVPDDLDHVQQGTGLEWVFVARPCVDYPERADRGRRGLLAMARPRRRGRG